MVYESGGSIAHSGILAGALVQSKWGTGHVWEHAPFETPLLYGNRCRIFGRPDAGFAGRVFEQFVANQRAAARRWG